MSERKCGCIYADAKNSPDVRSGHELGGYLKSRCPKHQQEFEEQAREQRETTMGDGIPTIGMISFERAFPDLYWHVAKGKLTESEPMYAALILRGEEEIGSGESNISAAAAFNIAFRNADLGAMNLGTAITAEMIERGVEEIRKAKHQGFDRWTDHEAIGAVLRAALSPSSPLTE